MTDRITDLRAEVEAILAEAKTHHYDTKRVFAAYNQALGLNERPQACSSCLHKCIRKLRKWLAAQPAATEKPAGHTVQTTEPPAPTPAKEPEKPAGPTPSEGLTEPPLTNPQMTEEGKSVNFEAEGKPVILFYPTINRAKFADGKAVPAGRYIDRNGVVLIVRIGGAARIEYPDLM